MRMLEALVRAPRVRGHIEVEHGGKRSSARAVSLDVIEASALAYLEVTNRVSEQRMRERLKPTDDVPTNVVQVV